MPETDFERCQEVFLKAMELPDGKRAHYLDQTCGSDTQFRRDVEQMLSHNLDKTLTRIGAGEPPGAPPAGPPPESPGESKPDPVPEKIGDYAIIEAIGEGGQSMVYRAVHPRLKTEVVIKVCRHAVAEGVNSAQSLRREAGILAQLAHPNVARVFDLDLHAGQPFLVMELIRGRNFKQYRTDNPISPREAARMVAMASRGVGAAHRAEVIHLDIKPGNIVRDENGHVKVIDFGIARRYGALHEEVLTKQVGTPPYFAPEQAQGKTELFDSRTDVFALGCVLFFMLTGKHAYGQQNYKQLFDALITGNFDRHPLEQTPMPGELRKICLKAMSADRAGRYADGDALADALEQFLRPAKKWPVLAAAFLATLLLSAVFYRLWHPLPQPTARAITSTTVPAVTPTTPVAPVATALRMHTDVYHQPDGTGWVPLDRAGRMLDGDLIRIRCEIPAGQNASLLLMDPQGNLTELARLSADAPDRQLWFPSQQSGTPLQPPSGTETFILVTRQPSAPPSPTQSPIDPAWLKQHWSLPPTQPPLAPGNALFLKDNQVTSLVHGRGLGTPVHVDDPADAIANQLCKLSLQLRADAADVQAVAFSHAAP